MNRVLNFNPINIMLATINGAVVMYNMSLFIKNIIEPHGAVWINGPCVIIGAIFSIYCLTERE